MQVANCRDCPLYEGATNSVPGSGNPKAKLMFIGEAPGYFEDQQGLPFVGNSGKLLDKLLNKIGIAREKVYIANILKHRPPGNRDPLPPEIVACSKYLRAQIEIINPKLIVTLGKFALNYFLPEEQISRARGKLFKVDWQGKRLVIFPTYHPSAGLRNGQMLAQMTADFDQLQKYILIKK